MSSIREHLDQAGEEIVAGNPFRALGHINSALAQLDAAQRADDWQLGLDCIARVPDPLVPRLDANPNTKEDA